MMKDIGNIVTVINQEIHQGGVRQSTLQLAVRGVTPLGVGSIFHHPVWPEQGPRKVTRVEWTYSEERVDIWVEPQLLDDKMNLHDYRKMAALHGWVMGSPEPKE